MAIDPKYGRVTVERGTIGADEIVILFRSKDELVPAVLDFYRQLCAEAGSPDHHLTGIDTAKAEVVRWQAANFTQVPQSADNTPGD